MPRVNPKAPTGITDYGFNWASWLNTGATISTSAWVVPSGITKDSDENTTTQTKIVLSGGGAIGTQYEVVNTITTSDGLTEPRTLQIKMGLNKGGEWVFE